MSLRFELPSGELHSSLQYHNVCVYITLQFIWCCHSSPSIYTS